MYSKKNALKIVTVIFILIFIVSSSLADSLELEQLKIPDEEEEIAVVETNHGNIKIRLFEEIAPKAVENFKTHAVNGYYDGVKFHRVIKDFMIQGGDPKGDGTGGESIWGDYFEDEFNENYLNIKGAVSMANAGPNTNGSQFFIVEKSEVEEEILKDMKEMGYSENTIEAYRKLGGTPWLDGLHTVFGQVIGGIEVVEQIAGVNVSEGDSVPENDVVIKSINILKYKDSKDISTEPQAVNEEKNEEEKESENKSDNRTIIIGLGIVFLLALVVAAVKMNKR